MSVIFGTVGASDRVDFGSAASLDDLATGGYTYLIWFYRTSTAVNQILALKGNGGAGPLIIWDNSAGAGTCNARLVHATSGTGVDVVAANGTSVLRRWECWGFTLTSAAAGNLFVGTEQSPIIQPAYFSRAGSGTPGADAGFSLSIGGGLSLPVSGAVAWASLYPRVLTLPEMEMWRRDTLAGSNPRVSGARLTSRLGGQQLDLSGNANHGTRTGSLLSNAEPRRIWVPFVAYQAAAAPLTADASDTVTFSDSAVATTVRVAVAADTVTFSDSAVALTSRVAAASDTIAFSDSAVAASSLVAAASDSITFSDSALAEVGSAAVAVDTITFSDSAVALTSRVADASDAIIFSDSAVALTSRVAAAADTISFTDSAVAIFDSGAAEAEDTIVFSDSAVAVLAGSVTLLAGSFLRYRRLNPP